MKCSNYNNILHINDKLTLLFNSYSGIFIAVKNRSILKNENLLELSNDSVIYKQLVDCGFLVDDSVDEYAKLCNLITETENNTDEYILHVNPTLDCNLNCWYCYENHIANSKMPETIVSNIIKFVAKLIGQNRIKRFELGFFGGEPLFYFNQIAKVLINEINELCLDNGVLFSVHFTSNATLLNDSIISYLAKYRCGFQITLDGDNQYHNQIRHFKNGIGTFEIIISNIEKLVKTGIDVIIRINYTSDNVCSLSKLVNRLSKIDDKYRQVIKIDLQRVWQDRKTGEDDTEVIIKHIRHKLNEHGYKVLANFIPHNVKNICYGDKINHSVINYNGDVFACTARDFSESNRIGYLETNGAIIYDENILRHRNNAKLQKQVCRTCRIAPICGGGCKQCALEDLGNNNCTFGYNENDKNNIILDIFEHSYNLG